uniref:uncharacterized protein LOC124074833 isoform X2 n=1 Tax=Scatophagus argus TaxID=75038 RepID=UPI001ED7FD1C|nr:uncharacterized protein LOC124074833 isoform X2 [Scatophagus argus]
MDKQRRQLTPEQDALEHIVACRDKPFLEERYIDSFKGRGVFTHKAIVPSAFVVEYRGKIFPHKDLKPKKNCVDTLNNYLFEFSWKGENWCIDASTEDKTLGRLVNDDHISPNCEVKKIVNEEKPHMCLFAIKEISPGEEITYNYGDSSYPWRSRGEDLEAASGSENFSSDDDSKLSDSGLSRENDSSEEMTGTLRQREHEAALRSEENQNGDCGPSKATRKPKCPSYTSKNYCYVCGAGFSKIARHLLRHAAEEPDIAEAFALPKKSKERKKSLEDLRNRGNYKHNQEVLKNNSGELKLRRRPTTVTFSAKEHMHCPYCKAMFKRKQLWKHVARSHSTEKPNSTAHGRSRVLAGFALAESPLSQKLHSGVWKMLSTMQQDDTASAIQNDSLLIQLAQNLSEKYEYNTNRYEYIRQKLREMGRLLIALHEKSIFSFEDAVKSKNFYKVVEAVKEIAGFDEKMQSYNKPSLALKLGHSLKKIGAIVIKGGHGNEQGIRDTKKFMKLCTNEWSQLVSQTALASLGGQKVNNPSTIPFTRDVQVFYRYLEKTSASAIERLKTDGSPQSYTALCRVTLAQVSVLNKGALEVSKMTLKAFQEREDTTRVLSKHFIRINILSRTGQNVAVLLTSGLVSAITLLVSKREACGIGRDNPFLFAKPDSSSSSLYHGRTCIRVFSALCRAKNPEHLRSVHLHKHIARIFQILNLENDELCHLAKLLGHDIPAERDYYRLPEAAVELAKIAKLLLAMEKGSLQGFKGNSLEDIEIDDELEPDVEQANSEASDTDEDNEESDLLLQQGDAEEQQTEKQRWQPTPEQDALEHIKARRDKPFLVEMFIDPVKGRGVFTWESIEPSTFVVEYRGNIIPQKETREKTCGDTLNNFLFDFSWSGTNWRIDASKEDGTLGRLVNDDHKSPNCKMKKIVCKGKPHLCLFAVKKISPGEEITYNYGDSLYPWRSKESSEELNTSQTDINASASSAEDENLEDPEEASSSAGSCCDDVYVPVAESSSDESSASSNNQRCQRKNRKMNPDSSTQQSSVQPVNASCAQQADEVDYSSDDFTSDGETQAQSHSNKNYCYVCGKAQSKISRHLFRHRDEEPEIAEVFALPLFSKKRNMLLDKLRSRGNYRHNQEVLKTCRGELKVRRRKSNMSVSAETFALCLFCKAMYSRKDMWRHMRKCSSRKSSTPSARGRSKVLALVAAAESTDPEEVSSELQKILKTMKKDEITSVVMNDPHILQLARCLYRSNERKTRKYDSISQRLRLMARLLLTLRKNSISSIEEAIKPQNFSKVVEAVRELAGFNEEKNSWDRPSIMTKLGNSLKKVGDINFARALKEEADKQTIHEAETFIRLCAKEWNYVPPSKRVNKAPTMQFMHDVQLFYQHVEKTAASAVESLTMYESPPVYNALLRVTLAQLSVLNKNVVELSKITLKSFNERVESERHEDVAGCLSHFDQMLSNHFVKINVMSNCGKNVVVTLTPKLLSAITLLVSKRETCGVHKSNPFLFARPVAIPTSVCQGHQSICIFANRCGAKNTVNLRSVFFRRHVARVFLILSLTNDELAELAKVLGRDIRTDQEYYQTPEASIDVAKLSELLSAIENGSLEKFEGKSLQEIEIADELEPDMEQDKSENSDAVEDNEESESSLQLTDIFSGHEAGLSSSRGSTAKRERRVSSSRRRGRGRSRKEDSENETPELNDEKNDEGNTGKDDGAEEVPMCCDINTPEKTLSCSIEEATKPFFSDEEDMNVDFDIDVDTDDDGVENEGNGGDSDTDSSKSMPLMPDVRNMTEQDDDSSETEKTNSSANEDTTVADLENTMDIDAVNQAVNKDQKKGEEQEKKNKLSAVLIGMKEVKILIPKLDIELQSPVHISKLSSVCNSVKRLVEDQPIHDNSNQRPTSPSSSDVKNKLTSAKAMQMTCSHCMKTMMKGQTAYQKKGFTDVFCSKDCLFEMFPVNKPVTKTCHYCHKAISQPLDLIMAAVDIKGTMKDFCSVTCLSSFKSNNVSSPTSQTPQPICSRCSKFCTTTHELTLCGTVHKFCSKSCLEDSHRDNTAICEHCNSACLNKTLMLKLQEEEEAETKTKTICSEECLNKFKETIRRPHLCTMCHTSRLVSDMVHYRSDGDVVELFCTHTCVTSYMLTVVRGLQENSSAQLKKRKGGLKSRLDENDAPAAAESDTATLAITKSLAVCCHCRKQLRRGHEFYQLKSSSEFFCSASCISEEYPHVKIVPKKCYNCFQVIKRPHNVILAPMDDSGTMIELCSDTCLSSVNSKRNMAAPKPPPPAGPQTECRMCARFCICESRQTLDGSMLSFCNDACFTGYCKAKNLPVVICDVCSSVCPEKRLVLKGEDGGKTLCSEECLVKFKERIETPQLCPLCQTSHRMSDMIENKNDEGMLDFFCSNRCMMVHEAQSLTVSGRKSPTFDDIDIKEVKPSLINLDFIKKEPIDEEYNHNLSPSISTEHIKDEPKVAKEDLMINSVFSLTEESTSPRPTETHLDLPASCSNCKKALIDGETVYQRKGRADIFCSMSCLLNFFQMKQAKKSCHFCLQAITQPQDVLQALVDTEETMKDFCSQTCLSSFSYKQVMSTKIPIVPVKSHSQCSICSRYCISKHEIIQQDVIHKICSDPCFLRFCNMNNLSVCENCRCHCNTPVMLKMENGSKKLCSADCLDQFKRKIIAPQPCAMCSTPCSMSDMVENRNSEDVVELFCTSSCVMASKIQAVSASGLPLNCDSCGKTTVPACHLAMSDTSIRNFCSLSCAMAFKETHSGATETAASDQTRSDFLKSPEKLPCAQCRRILKSTPKVVQKKGKMNFVCSLACSEEFKRANNIMGKCEYCKNERIIRDARRVDGKDCYFCSDDCKMLFHHELEKKWGEHCQSCAYCLSISKTLVTAQYKGTEEEFCSDDCNTKYKMLFCHVAKCDTCGREGKLRQSLPMLGKVKHFCDLKCLLHYCNRQVQMFNTVSSPPRSAGAAASSPVITNVISLAGALAQQCGASACSPQPVPVPDIQTKVVGHTGVQTVPKEVKNKSMLCTPLVHNKGVWCTTQSVDTETQTDSFVPKATDLPVPLPVYVPVPMNMYSQYTPTPVGILLPLPVPLFVPVKLDSPDPTVKPVKERNPSDPFEGELTFKPEMKKTQDEKNETEDALKDRLVGKEGQSQEIPKEHWSDVLHADRHSIFNSQEDSGSGTAYGSFSRPHTDVLSEPQPELPPAAPPPRLEVREDPRTPPSPAPTSPLLQQTVGKVHNKNKLQQLSKAVKRNMSRKHRKLNSRRGIDAWKRWIQWRESQTSLNLVSSRAVTLNEDVLLCSATELSDGLFRFIREVKRADGEPYSPDSLFYLCLSIQQYLFENGRMENIFSDMTYDKFSREFTEILKGFKPSVTASGYIHSRVEEEFLWDCKQLGAYSPIVLLNTLLFFCCKYFGFTTVEQHRQLSFAHIKCCTRTNQNYTKTTFLRFCPPISINETESDADAVPAKKRKKNECRAEILEMMENTENPLRCPVRLYEFYLSKSSESVRQSTDLFYLQPDGSCVPDSPWWYSSTPLDSSIMEAMLAQILAVRELQEGDGGRLDQQRSDDREFVPDEEESE